MESIAGHGPDPPGRQTLETSWKFRQQHPKPSASTSGHGRCDFSKPGLSPRPPAGSRNSWSTGNAAGRPNWSASEISFRSVTKGSRANSRSWASSVAGSRRKKCHAFYSTAPHRSLRPRQPASSPNLPPHLPASPEPGVPRSGIAAPLSGLRATMKRRASKSLSAGISEKIPDRTVRVESSPRSDLTRKPRPELKMPPPPDHMESESGGRDQRGFGPRPNPLQSTVQHAVTSTLVCRARP